MLMKRFDMKRVTIFIVLIFMGLTSPGQVNKYGIPLIKNYSSAVIRGSDYTHSMIKDDLGNLYLANEDMGIIRYDGNNWRTITVRNNKLIRVLGKDKQGTIYAAGKYEFGYLEPDLYGKMTYVSLSQRLEENVADNKEPEDTTDMVSGKSRIDVGEILSLAVKDSSVLFASSDALFTYDIINDSLTYIKLAELNLKNVLKVFLVGEKIILGDNSKGLYEFKNGTVEMLPGGDFFKRMRCMVIMPYGNAQAIVATYEYGAYLYNYITGEITQDFFDPKLQALLKDLRLYSGAVLPDSEYALGTIQGGVFIIDKNGKLVRQWDVGNSNLMDNGILAFYCDPDKNSELWVSTIRFVSKVYINLPFTEFSPKSGIDGGVNCICDMDGITYIATDLGVFKSGINSNGHLEFSGIPEFIDQVFPIVHASVNDEEFLLAGSINGLFQIKKSGKVVSLTGSALAVNERKKLDMNVRVIVQSKLNPSRFYIGRNSEGVTVIEYTAGKWKTIRTYKCSQGSVTGIVEPENGDLFFSTDFSNNVFKVASNDTIPVLYGKDKGVPETAINSIARVGDEIVMSTGKGLWKYLKVSDSWVPCNEITGNYSDGKEALMTMQDHNNDLWFAHKDTRYIEMLFKNSNGNISSSFGPLALLPNVRMLDIKSIDNLIYMAKSNSVYVIDKEKILSEIPVPPPLLSKISVGRDSLLMEESFTRKDSWGKYVPASTWSGSKFPELSYNLNSISFFWSTPFYIDEELTLYSYRLDGFDNVWSNWERVFYKDYTNLPFGHYYFRVKSKTATEVVTEETVYEFVILKPWYLTAVMIVLYVFAVIGIILLIIKAYTKKLKNENIRLEGIVAERTAVVVKQKEELESSIHYASRIQMALLPSEEILSENIKNYFVLFKPRDIVSGDFYWMTKKGNRLYIVAADCTGHGVPGAFMSLLGMSFLDEIIDKDLAPRADYILHELRLHVTESLKQVGEENEAKDGMDMSLLVIDFESQRIEFSGAYNPCFRVRKLSPDEQQKYAENSDEMPDGSMSNGKYILETIYASKMPIGISSRMNEEFVFHDWALEKGISYYLFSDGYLDQFGGPNGRKFMKKNFKRLILDVQDHPMPKQKELLDNNLKEWMGRSPQIDDILVVGIRT